MIKAQTIYKPSAKVLYSDRVNMVQTWLANKTTVVKYSVGLFPSYDLN